MATLKARKFIHQDPRTRQYGIGIRVVELAAKAKKERLLKKAMLPTLKKLSSDCRECVNAGILDYTEVVYIVNLESEESLRFSIREGTRLPAHCTAMGKVLLSSLSDESLEEMYPTSSAFKRMTSHSISTLDNFLKTVADVRNNRIAYDFEECFLGVCCLAAPVPNFSGDAIAAVSISGPAVRMTEKRMDEMIGALKNAVTEISREFQDSPRTT